MNDPMIGSRTRNIPVACYGGRLGDPRAIYLARLTTNGVLVCDIGYAGQVRPVGNLFEGVVGWLG